MLRTCFTQSNAAPIKGKRFVIGIKQPYMIWKHLTFFAVSFDMEPVRSFIVEILFHEKPS